VNVTTKSSEVRDVYRDDPLDDEAELREVIGEAPVDQLLEAGGTEAVLATIDALRLLQGWVDDDTAAAWLTTAQRRLEDRSPLEALAAGREDEVLDALRTYLASQA
jgi:hypothetical protein